MFQTVCTFSVYFLNFVKQGVTFTTPFSLKTDWTEKTNLWIFLIFREWCFRRRIVDLVAIFSHSYNTAKISFKKPTLPKSRSSECSTSESFSPEYFRVYLR